MDMDMERYLRESIARELYVTRWACEEERWEGASESYRMLYREMADAVLAVVGPHVEALEAQVERVRALHCDDGDGFCYGCGYSWPCYTADALAPQPAATEEVRDHG